MFLDNLVLLILLKLAVGFWALEVVPFPRMERSGLDLQLRREKKE